MQTKWRVKDLIDLEYFLNQAPGTGSDKTLSPDRRLYLTYEKTHTPPFSRRDLIKYWLDDKRKIGMDDIGRLPGNAYNETIGLLRFLIILAALLSGASLAWSVLSYGGTAPINIFTCIWIMIVPQFLLLMFLALSLLFSRLGFSLPFKGLYPFLSGAILYVAGRLKRTGDTAITGSQRARFQSLIGMAGQRKTLYGSVFFWPVFILLQTFGLCFNIGLLSATILKLSITDLAFGWQSTLHPNPETVYRLVDTFSLPWSWLSSPHPTIAQIQGSQMILKDGIMHLATTDLVSWWPFLCFSILFYGLLPRLLLLTGGILRLRRAVGNIGFTSSGCDRLVFRMQTPHVETGGRAYAASNAEKRTPRKHEPEEEAPGPEPAVEPEPAIVFVPEDIEERIANDDLDERIAHILGLKMITRVRMEMDPDTDMSALEAALIRTGASRPATRIMVLIEAWQPPIGETMSWIKRLRDAAGPRTGLIIGLIGKPAEKMIYTSPDDTDRVIWEQAVNRLGDPFIRVENMGG